MTYLKRVTNFSLLECKRSKTTVAEEYYWAITKRGGDDAADRVPLCWNLDFSCAQYT